jgi:hypothetical protein
MLRTINPTPFNQIANDPEVRPWLGAEDPTAEIDLANVVGNTNNICATTADGRGGYLLVKASDGVYMAHSMAIPDERGKHMVGLMREVLSTMFMATDAVEIWTQVPDGNERADALARLAGFREVYRREGLFPLFGERVGISFRKLEFGDWVVRESNNKALGRLVHGRIEQALGGLDHDEDHVHDAWVGAAAGCAIESNLHKGVILYNRWADIAGYQRVQILSAQPALVDMGSAVIQFLSGRFDVLVKRAEGGVIPTAPASGNESCPPPSEPQHPA